MKHMKRLKILRIEDFDTHDDSIEYLPNSLQWFHCHKYPWKSLPKAFEPKRLVYLSLRSSCLRDHLWTEIKHLPYLRRLDLRYSDDLMRTPNFTEMPNLEYLDLNGCTSLEEVHHSLACSRKLIKLNLSECESLKRFPCVNVESLESLNLYGCYSLEKFPEILGIMKPELEIRMSYSGLRELPSSIIGCLSSLKKLYNFEHLPQSISHLSALQYLDLSDCKRLTQLPEIPQQFHTIYADWSNDSICNSLFQNISSLQHDNVSASNSLSLRVFTSRAKNIPSWFHHREMDTSHVSVNLPENWYVSDKLLGFAVCYSGKLIDTITAYLIPLCEDGMSSMTRKLSLSNHSKYAYGSTIHFFLVPLSCLWDACKANGKTPNDYGCIRLDSPGDQMKEFGVRLLYKDEAEVCIGI